MCVGTLQPRRGTKITWEYLNKVQELALHGPECLAQQAVDDCQAKLPSGLMLSTCKSGTHHFLVFSGVFLHYLYFKQITWLAHSPRWFSKQQNHKSICFFGCLFECCRFWKFFWKGLDGPNHHQFNHPNSHPNFDPMLHQQQILLGIGPDDSHQHAHGDVLFAAAAQSLAKSDRQLAQGWHLLLSKIFEHRWYANHIFFPSSARPPAWYRNRYSFQDASRWPPAAHLADWSRWGWTQWPQLEPADSRGPPVGLKQTSPRPKVKIPCTTWKKKDNCRVFFLAFWSHVPKKYCFAYPFAYHNNPWFPTSSTLTM